MKTSTIQKISNFPGAIDPRILEQLFDQCHDIAFFMKDKLGCYCIVNHSIVERHGLKNKSQLLGLVPEQICPGELGKRLSDQDRYVLQSGKPILDRLELHWYSPNNPGWCLTSKIPIISDRGTVIGLIGISKDVRTAVSIDDIPAGVATALRYLEDHFQDPIGPSDLARIAMVTTSRFGRIVHRMFGMTTNQWIAKTRLTHATQLLVETDDSISSISHACGFSDHSAFTRAFRNAMGTSPSDYRQRESV